MKSKSNIAKPPRAKRGKQKPASRRKRRATIDRAWLVTQLDQVLGEIQRNTTIVEAVYGSAVIGKNAPSGHAYLFSILALVVAGQVDSTAAIHTKVERMLEYIGVRPTELKFSNRSEGRIGEGARS